MVDSPELSFLKSQVEQASSREALDTCFKKWREKNILPLRQKIAKETSAHERKKLGLSLQSLITESQAIYEDKKKLFASWLLPFYEARSHSVDNFALTNYDSRNLLGEFLQKVIDFLMQENFAFYEESEIVNVTDNFDALLMPPGHPARAESDSFFLKSNQEKDNILEPKMLRTHTTTSTLKLLQQHKRVSFKGSSFGSVYRKEDNNSTHLSQFTQLDCIWVDRSLKLEDLRNFITSFLSFLMTCDKKYRLRRSYFPFTSPSYEVDITCDCKIAAECRLCKGTKWIEILGCGFLRPEILQDTHPGWVAIAAGVGIERLAMICYSINDMRELYENNLDNLVVTKG